MGFEAIQGLIGQIDETLAITDLSDVSAVTGTGTTVVFSASPTFTGTLNAAGITFTGVMLAPNGTAGAPSFSLSAAPTYGIFSLGGTSIDISIAGTRRFAFAANEFSFLYDAAVIYLGAAGDCNVGRVSASILKLTNVANACEWRVHGDATVYGALSHNATDTVLSGSFGHISLRTVDIATAANVVNHVATATITGAVTDGYTAGLRLTPTYSAATAQTVTRHNYIDLNGPTLSGAGPAALTDACVFRFNAAAGTHKATVGASTKTTPGGWDASIKININGTIFYIPAYLSTTA